MSSHQITLHQMTGTEGLTCIFEVAMKGRRSLVEVTTLQFRSEMCFKSVLGISVTTYAEDFITAAVFVNSSQTNMQALSSLKTNLAKSHSMSTRSGLYVTNRDGEMIISSDIVIQMSFCVTWNKLLKQVAVQRRYIPIKTNRNNAFAKRRNVIDPFILSRRA